VLRRLGRGYMVRSGIFDPFRRRTFTVAEVCGPAGELVAYLVRECDWIARTKMTAKGAAFVRLDPETGETHAIAGLGSGERVVDVVPDGRLVVSGGAGGAALLDPETGERVQLALEGAPLAGDGLSVLAPSPIDPLVFRISSGWQWLARLDPERAVLRPATGAAGGLLQDLGGSDAETSYAVEDARRIVRVRFGTDEREVVFPRPAAD
jgi:streptogramin lyase